MLEIVVTFRHFGIYGIHLSDGKLFQFDCPNTANSFTIQRLWSTS